MKRKSFFVLFLAAFLLLMLFGTAFAADLPFDSMKMVKGSSGYLYEAYYQTTTDEGFALVNALCKSLFTPAASACTSVRKGNFYGRNFDYDLDEFADFVIHSAAGNGHYASIALDGGMLGREFWLIKQSGYTKQRLDEILAGAKPSPMEEIWLKFLPYVVMDGINEHGLVCNINMAQKGVGIEPTTGTNPKADVELYIALCPRYILDKCSSAKEAVETMRNINIWASGSASSVQTEYHIMLADAKNTYVVEFKNNKMLVKEISDKPYITNFNLLLSDSETVQFDDKGHVVRESIVNYTGGYDASGKFDQGRANGIERYNIIVDSYAGLKDRAGMRELLDTTGYSHLYKNPKSRFTEFVRDNTKFEPYIPNMQDDFRYLSLKSATNDMDALCVKYDIENAMQNLLDELDRRESLENYSHTVHSCIYDIASKKVWVKEQELGREPEAWTVEHCFSLNDDSSSGGCNTGFGLLTLLFAVPLFVRRKKQ